MIVDRFSIPPIHTSMKVIRSHFKPMPRTHFFVPEAQRRVAARIARSTGRTRPEGVEIAAYLFGVSESSVTEWRRKYDPTDASEDHCEE